MRGPTRCLSLAAAALLLGAGCASTPSSQTGFLFFEEASPSEGDPWYPKVADWQARMQARPSALNRRPPERRSGLLRIKMAQWAQQERRELARRIFQWTVEEARHHYRFDPITDVAGDPWPTTGELLQTNGDDCDGLDLIAYALLREFGFPPDELYRAIVRRDRDGGTHMVTLWFEDRQDPWIFDATGAMTLKLRKFSKILGWTPTKVFNEEVQYTPVRVGRASQMARRAGP